MPHDGPMCDLLWSDPEDTQGWGVSPRGELDPERELEKRIRATEKLITPIRIKHELENLPQFKCSVDNACRFAAAF